MITCLASGRSYIGSASRKIARRWAMHRYQLRRGRHHSRHLQRAWNKHGAAQFQFRVLLVCRPEDVLMYERLALDAYQPAFNSAPIAGSTRGIAPSLLALTRSAAARDAITPRYWVGSERLTLAAIAKRAGVSKQSIEKRVARGVKGEALLAPARAFAGRQYAINGELLYLSEIVRKYGVKEATILYRARRGLTGADLVAPLRKNQHARRDQLSDG